MPVDTAPAPAPVLTLSPDQEAACTAILDGLRAGTRAQTLVGPAGTGKTTVVKELVRRIRAADSRQVAFAAPTGKATVRLRESTGEQASTVHSLIYGKPTNMGQCPDEACGEWSADLAVSRLELRARSLTHRVCPKCKGASLPDADIKVKLKFEKKKGNAEEAEIESDAILIVDEASMVNEALHTDILENLPGVTVVYVGDREQLPPVEGKWGPDFRTPAGALTQIHRQAAGNPIIRVANALRDHNNRPRYPFSRADCDREGRFTLGDGSVDIAARWLADARERGDDATLITYTNRTRQAVNNRVREFRGLVTAANRTGVPLVPGDRLLVLGNNRSLGVSNGEVFEVESAEWLPAGKLVGEGEIVSVKLVGRTERVLVPMAVFGADRREFMAYRSLHANAWENAQRADASGERARALNLADPETMLHADYGECLTCHKAQGSQWAHVGVVWDKPLWGMWFNDADTGCRWAYTAVTRAAQTLRVWYVK